MRKIHQAFLALLRSGIRGEKPEDPALSPDAWEELLRLAFDQQILPLIFDTACSLPSFRQMDRGIYRKQRELSVKIAVREMVQTNDFLSLYAAAQKEGLRAMVLKGIVCRSLYLQPCLRPSMDEDLLIPEGEMEAWYRFLTAQGLSSDDSEGTGERSYHKPNSPTYLELHGTLFPESSSAYGDLNELFEGAWDRAEPLQAEDVSLLTLSPTDHLLYLLCHAYKHFLHSGIGMRHVADIGLFALRYHDRIDGQRLYRVCEEKKIQYFCAALFRIAREELGISAGLSPFEALEADPGPMLADILTDGLYGADDPDRIHSSNITLDAVAAGKQGRARRGIRKSLFPGKAYLQQRFPYAAKHPWLLPAAWAQRIWLYLAGGGTSASRSIQIGRVRIELLKQYKIIPRD